MSVMGKGTSSSDSNAAVSRSEFDALVLSLAKDKDKLESENADLKKQLEWFKRQLFGPKSEKRIEPNPYQLSLGEAFAPPMPDTDEREKETITYKRGKGPKVRPEDCVTDAGLRFDPSVPMKTIALPVLELNGLCTTPGKLCGTVLRAARGQNQAKPTDRKRHHDDERVREERGRCELSGGFAGR